MTRCLAASVAITWPALLVSDELPPDGALNGKADDIVTGCIMALLALGLLAAGWLRPLWLVLPAVLLLGIGVPLVYDALDPRECPVGAAGMDCLPRSYGTIFAPVGLVVVSCGFLVRRVVGAPSTALRSG